MPHKAVTPGFVSSLFEAPTGQLPWPPENWLLDSGKLMFCPWSVSWLSLTCSTLIIFQRNSLHGEMRQGFLHSLWEPAKDTTQRRGGSQILYLLSALIRGQMLTMQQQQQQQLSDVLLNGAKPRLRLEKIFLPLWSKFLWNFTGAISSERLRLLHLWMSDTGFQTFKQSSDPQDVTYNIIPICKKEKKKKTGLNRSWMLHPSRLWNWRPDRMNEMKSNDYQ